MPTSDGFFFRSRSASPMVRLSQHFRSACFGRDIQAKGATVSRQAFKELLFNGQERSAELGPQGSRLGRYGGKYFQSTSSASVRMSRLERDPQYHTDLAKADPARPTSSVRRRWSAHGPTIARKAGLDAGLKGYEVTENLDAARWQRLAVRPANCRRPKIADGRRLLCKCFSHSDGSFWDGRASAHIARQAS